MADDIAKLKAWPRDFLPSRLKQEKINARVYSLGYNANFIKRAAPNATIASHAEDLLANLLADRSRAVCDVRQPMRLLADGPRNTLVRYILSAIV